MKLQRDNTEILDYCDVRTFRRAAARNYVFLSDS